MNWYEENENALKTLTKNVVHLNRDDREELIEELEMLVNSLRADPEEEPEADEYPVVVEGLIMRTYKYK